MSRASSRWTCGPDNGLTIPSMTWAKEISAAVLAGEPVAFQSAFPVEGTVPAELSGGPEARLTLEVGVRRKAHPVFAPRCLVLGLGCRKGKTAEEIALWWTECWKRRGFCRRRWPERRPSTGSGRRKACWRSAGAGAGLCGFLRGGAGGGAGGLFFLRLCKPNRRRGQCVRAGGGAGLRRRRAAGEKAGGKRRDPGGSPGEQEDLLWVK